MPPLREWRASGSRSRSRSVPRRGGFWHVKVGDESPEADDSSSDDASGSQSSSHHNPAECLRCIDAM